MLDYLLLYKYINLINFFSIVSIATKTNYYLYWFMVNESILNVKNVVY